MCVQRISSVDTERMCVCTLAHFRTYVGYTTRYAFLLIVEDMQKSVYSWDPCAFEMATVLLFVSKTLQYVCVCVCVCCGQGNNVPFPIAVVRSEDASVCLCCQGSLVRPVRSTFSLLMESRVC